MKINRRHPFISADTGFTLVELMVTVLILGILVTTAVGLFNTAIQKADRTACTANVETINLAIARAALISGQSTGSLNDSDIDPYITGGLASLQCSAKPNPVSTYHVVGGVITPAHNHQ